MARIELDAGKVKAQLSLEIATKVSELRALVSRTKEIYDRTRLGPNFAPLGTDLGVSEAQAEDMYGRLVTMQTDLTSGNFANVADFDQG